jgi:hypothetical protein
MTQDKKTATKAARELLLGDRLPVIERLAEAKARLTSLKDKEAEARTARLTGEDEVREQYDAAVKKGWSSGELRSLGFLPPRKRRDSSAARSTNGHRSSPTPMRTSEPAADTGMGAATAVQGAPSTSVGPAGGGRDE